MTIGTFSAAAGVVAVDLRPLPVDAGFEGVVAGAASDCIVDVALRVETAVALEVGGDMTRDRLLRAEVGGAGDLDTLRRGVGAVGVLMVSPPAGIVVGASYAS